MKVRDIMTANPATCTPDSTAEQVARLLEQHDCGALPVVEGDAKRLIGMITDRDLVIRGLAHGKGGDAKVRDLMSPSPATVQADDDIEKVEVGRTMILDGWGIHYSVRGGWVWNLWGRDCVALRLKNGGVLRIGTDDASNLAGFLEGKIARQGT